MVPRLLIAVVGSGLITSAMLLGMNEIAQRFKERDPMQYFQIADFVPAPEGRRPARPPAPEAPPERPRIEHTLPTDTRLPISSPTVDEERLTPPPLVPEPENPVPGSAPR